MDPVQLTATFGVPPFLLVLNACAAGDAVPDFRGGRFAAACATAGVEHTVAMQYPIPGEAGLMFAQQFYRSLVCDPDVGRAVLAARRELWLQPPVRDWPSWICPVHYADRHAQLL
jgi:hypothetical protein